MSLSVANVADESTRIKTPQKMDPDSKEEEKRDTFDCIAL